MLCYHLTRVSSIKYVTLKEEGVREGVTVCDREHVTSHLDFFIIHMTHEILSDV